RAAEDEAVAADPGDRVGAGQAHRGIELAMDHGERARYALFAQRAEAVEHGAADIGPDGTERDRLVDVLTGLDAAVDMHFGLAAHGRDYGRQGGDRRHGAVELPP